jgi:hypothetical protein
MRKPVMAFFVFFDITCLALTHFVQAQPQEKNPRFACVSNFFTLQEAAHRGFAGQGKICPAYPRLYVQGCTQQRRGY